MAKVIGNTALKSDEKVFMVTLPKTAVNESEILQPVAETKQEPKPEPTPGPVNEQPKPLSFEQIREKGETLFNLLQKFDEVKAKADELKSFKISHNNENAKIVISDATGRSFVSANPKAISKFIDYCSEQMGETLQGLETEMRKLA
jgi:hypothetical protein